MKQRIILVRHGQPHVPAARRIGHRGFSDYVEDYQAAGLHPESDPPDGLAELVDGLDRVFTSDLPRANDSARRLVPGAEMLSDPVFTEAPLPAPRIPLVRMNVPSWAVLARIAWHAGYTPRIENYQDARDRARRAADILVEHAGREGRAVLVAHGYFNMMIGRELRRRGFRRQGRHRAVYWNVVVYKGEAAIQPAITRASA